MLRVRFSTWLLWEPSAVLCEDPHQPCQHGCFLFQRLGKHGKTTKLALQQGTEEPKGPWGLPSVQSWGMCFSIPTVRATTHRHSRGPRTVHRALRRGKGTCHLHLSWFAEHFLRGRSTALLASPVDQGGLMETIWPKAAKFACLFYNVCKYWSWGGNPKKTNQ